MNDTVLDAIESDAHSAEEAIALDACLSNVKPGEVPDHQLKSVIDYIDFRFLHEAVVQSLRDDLSKLHEAPSDRHFAA